MASSIRWIRRAVLVGTDLLMAVTALYIACFIRIWLGSINVLEHFDDSVWRYTFSGLLFVFLISLLYLSGLYSKRNDFWEETRYLYKTVYIVFVTSLILTFIAKTTQEYSRVVMVLLGVNLLWLLPLGRLFAKWLMYHLNLWQKKVWISGNDLREQELKKNLYLNWYLGYEPVQSYSDADVTILTVRDIPAVELENKIHRYQRDKKEVILIPYLHNLSFSHANIVNLIIGRASMISVQNQLFLSKNIVLKKIAELLLVIATLPFIILIFGVIALWVKFDSRGPVLFRQPRMGKNGKEFVCYKFRSMYIDGQARLEAYLKDYPEELTYYEQFHKYRNDPRITKAGRILRKLSLDELPQLLNVLKGEMNLIGPRPYVPEEKEKIGENLEMILHVPPGLTGLWQVSGRNELDFMERVELDTWYIRNWSLWLDFIIFIKTFQVLLTRRGAK